MDKENIPPIIHLNTQICELVGAFIGDGYLTNCKKGQYVFGISGHRYLDEDYIKYLKNIILENFPSTKPKLYYRTDEKTIMLKVCSKEIYIFFKNLGFNSGKKAHTVKIPKKIINNDEFIRTTIRGIFDTDGCVYLDKRKTYAKPYSRITLQVASIELIEQLESFLSNHFKLYVNKKNRDGYRNYIEIYGLKQLAKYLKIVGFSNQRHLKKMPL